MDFQGISGAWLDELKQKVDIVQLISASVALSRKGNLWWGCCPFHHEKTPSFAVDERKGYYRCYGCHEGGDIISWVQKTESLEFMDAVKYLAKIAGMKVPETQRDAKAVARRERLLGMMKLAARHYYENLGKNPRAQEYLRSRGLSEGLVRHFGLGYSQGGQALIKTLSDAGYSLKEMQDCSLIGTNSEDGTHYDFLANRLIVPVFDAYGNVVAFGGRILEKREGVAKYKNSRETELFQKSRTLYGLNFVKKYRMQHKVDALIVVEGYMDTIALWEAGFGNVVASMGTALTDQQTAMMKRIVDKVYICYDGDAAGQTSTMRGLEILKKDGLEVRVVSLPDGLDPDEMIRRRGKDAYVQCLREALPLYEHKIAKAAAEFDLASADGRSNYAKKCLLIIADLDPVEQEAYMGLISERTAISVGSLRQLVKRGKPVEKPQQEAPTSTASPKPKGRPDYVKACRWMLNLMLVEPGYSENWPTPDRYVNESHRRMCAHVIECMATGAPIVPSDIYRLLPDEPECGAVLSVELPEGKEELARLFADQRACIDRYWAAAQIEELKAALAETQDENEKRMLLTQISRLMRMSK